MIKKPVLSFIAIIVMIIGIYSVGFVETHYTRSGEVVTVIGETVRVKDTSGNLWEFYGTGYNHNDKVKMTMYTNHTDLDIYDDEVSYVRKIK